MTATSDPPSLREKLLYEHEQVDAALARLVDAFATGDRDVARSAFREFDAMLSLHLKLEEELLLPLFARAHPQEAAQILDEHGAIRRTLDELGIGTDLHLTRLPRIRELAAMLREHASREDALFYPWIDAQPWPRGLARPSAEPVPSSRPA